MFKLSTADGAHGLQTNWQHRLPSRRDLCLWVVRDENHARCVGRQTARASTATWPARIV